MNTLALHEYHKGLNARFSEINGREVVGQYDDPRAEHAALVEAAGALDLGFRSRLCLLGADRQNFLNGQVTNNVRDLKVGQGCYAALVNAKGKMQSDLYVYILENEILLDFEPGYGATVTQRLEKYIIAEDVQVTDVAPHYGLLSLQGPKSEQALRLFDPGMVPPVKPLTFVSRTDSAHGEIYWMNQPRLGTCGFDLFVPAQALGAVADQLIAAVKSTGGCACGWNALEAARIEAGFPRFGIDMDENNLPPETGIESRAVSYTKGCYIGQEVIARIRTYGQVAKVLKGLRLADSIKVLPQSGDKLYQGDKEIGYVTSALASAALKSNVALAYVRRGHNQTGSELTLRSIAGDSVARIVELPFRAG